MSFKAPQDWQIKSILTLIIMMLCSVSASAQGFKHPGIYVSKAQLDFIKARVNAGAEPWASAYQKMVTGFKPSLLTMTPNPCETFSFDGCRHQIRGDGGGAYSHALQWYITGNKAHAEKAIQILNAWASTHKRYGSGPCLAMTWGMPRMVNGAEIIKHTYNGWAEADQKKFANWLDNIVYKNVSGCSAGDRNNWDTGGISNAIVIAVYLDDRGKFNSQVSRLRSTIGSYIRDNGCNNESDRDQGHSQMLIGHLASAAEVAWQQGEDVWSAHSNRLLHAMELSASYGLGKSVSGCGMSSVGRGHYHPIYEVPYNHYVNRKKLKMPSTAEFIKKGRPEGADEHMMPWATLTHAETGNLDGAIPNNPTANFTLSLKSGWNLISLPLQPEAKTVETVLSGIAGKYEAIYAYNGSTGLYQSYTPGEAGNDLTSLEAGRGYWIYITAASDLIVKGTASTSAITLNEGWNLAGFNSITSKPVATAVQSVEGKIDAVYSFDTAANQYLEYIPGETSTLTNLVPGQGYWIYATEETNWTLK
jgi:hypothetical protein